MARFRRWFKRRVRPMRNVRRLPIKAVIVGLDYRNIKHISSLNGAVSDALKFRKALIRDCKTRSRHITTMIDSIKDRNSNKVRYRLITPSDIITAIVGMFKKAKEGDVLVYYFAGHGGLGEVKQYSNNSGKIEYQMTSDGYLRDAVMRQLAETVPVGCLFYILTDCCRSGGFVEGLPEQIGTSTRSPIITKLGVEPRFNFINSFGLRKTSDTPNAIHFSACQNFQGVKEFDFIDENQPRGYQPGGFFTHSLIKLLRQNRFQFSNIDLIKAIKKRTRNKKIKNQNPGLYCSDVQAEFNFLSFEWMGLSRKRKTELEKKGLTAIESLKNGVDGEDFHLPHKVLSSSLKGGDDEFQWERMVDDFLKKGRMRNCLAVCDGSMEVSVALGLLVSELSDRPWKGKVINFSSEPELHVIEGNDLRSKKIFVEQMIRGMDIDFRVVFDSILNVAVEENLKKDEMIKRIFVLSNMGFDQASANSWETDYKEITRKYIAAGYGSAVPQIVFWNLKDSRIGPMPATQNGVELVSGFSENLLALFLVNEGVITL